MSKKIPLICKHCESGIITAIPFKCPICSGNFHPRCVKTYSNEFPASCCSLSFTNPNQPYAAPLNSPQNDSSSSTQQQPNTINLINFNPNSPILQNPLLQVSNNISTGAQLPSTSQAINNNNTFSPDYSLLPQNWDNLTTDQKITYTMTTILKSQIQSNETNSRQQNQIDSNTHSIQ